MTDKELLLKDLCNKLPYKVKARYFDPESERYEIDIIDGIDLTYNPEILISQYGLKVDEVKPYLRSMSSMTEEEKKIYQGYQDAFCTSSGDIHYFDNFMSIDYLNYKHFDYYGLIEKGLALEASEEMYKNE